MKNILLTIGVIATTALTLSSEAKAKPDRPLIFIPGILGSKIWIDGSAAWYGAESLMNLENLRIPDGPKDTKAAATCGPDENAEFCGLLEEFAILGPIKLDQYVDLIDYLVSLGYTRNGKSRDLFIFTYDWRRSNFETAGDFRNFVNSTPGLIGKEFDVLAHSIGGLVALIYATQFDTPSTDEDCATLGRCRIKTVITAGTPYLGSMNAVAIPLEGWGWISRQLTGGSKTITRTVLSWPSFYELLPMYDSCCSGDTKATMADYSTFSQLPYVVDDLAPSQETIEAALLRRRELDTIVQKGWPDHIREKSAQCDDKLPRQNLYLIAGDHNDTKRRVTLIGAEPKYDERRGDGTVLLRSAALSKVGEAWLSFVEHDHILDDANVKAKLQHILFRCTVDMVDFAAPTPVVSLEQVSGPHIEVPLETASARIIQHGGAGKPLSFSVEATLAVAVLADVVAPTATLRATVNGVEFIVRDLDFVKTMDEGTNRRFLYYAENVELPHPGLVEVEITVAGSVTVSDKAMSF